MARTRNGNLTGRAGAEQLADQRRWLHDEAMRAADAARLKREAEEITEENDLIRMAIVIEGETSFFRWWDDDEQVPVHGKRSERIELLKKRCGVHDESVAKEAGDGDKGQEKAQE